MKIRLFRKYKLTVEFREAVTGLEKTKDGLKLYMVFETDHFFICVWGRPGNTKIIDLIKSRLPVKIKAAFREVPLEYEPLGHSYWLYEDEPIVIVKEKRKGVLEKEVYELMG